MKIYTFSFLLNRLQTSEKDNVKIIVYSQMYQNAKDNALDIVKNDLKRDYYDFSLISVEQE
jgi:hypothetical protein